MSFKNPGLKDFLDEDIEDVLVKIEISFGIKFGIGELKDVKTFGELCDIIEDKIHLHSADNCTSQQAFYKLRKAIAKKERIDKLKIKSDTHLSELIPRQYRKKKIREIEDELGFKLKVLRSKISVTISLACVFLMSLVLIFFNWKVGLAGLVSSTLGAFLATYLGREFNVESVAELAGKMSREHYLKSRRHSSTVNKREVVKIIKDLFVKDLALEPEVLNRDAALR